MDNDAHSAPVIGIIRHKLGTDGQGITTLIAFAGCPLRCRHCLNPQSISPHLSFPHYDAGTLYNAVRGDALYFLATGGGITFGGGEPGLRSRLIRKFRDLCGGEWRLTLETSLNIDRSHLRRLRAVIDEYIVDIKDLDPGIYRRYTGQSNERVMNNLRWMAREGLAERTLLRIPLIPGYNTDADTGKSIRQLQEYGFSRFDCFTYQTTDRL